MAEQDLHNAEVNALFEQPSGEAVPERVAGERVAQQTCRNISRVGSLRGTMRSLFRLPTTRSNICFESIAEIGRLAASLMRRPQAYIVHMQAR